MSEYTKGPWEYGEYSKDNACGFYVRPIDRLKSDVAQIDWYQSTTRSMDEHEANARLIAAAPEMADELERRNKLLGQIAVAALQKQWDEVTRICSDFVILFPDGEPTIRSAAIAKAKGES